MSPRRLVAALAILAVTGCADGSAVESGAAGTGGSGSSAGSTAAGDGGGGDGGAGTGASTATGGGSSPTTSVSSGGGSSSTGDATTSVTTGASCTVPGQCPPTGTACLIQACQAGVCDPLLAAPGAPCSDGGGTECNAFGQCTAAACNNGVMDGDERGIDCGGGDCPGCPVGTACGGPVDCATEACVGALCVACGANAQPCCPGDTCTGAVDTCVENLGQAWGGTIRECNCGVLREGQVLRVGDSRRSCDGGYRLVMQGDGNLVLYVEGGAALWSSDTFGTGSDRAIMQGDGNFVVYDATNQPHFDTGTQSVGAYLAVQGDGNLVVYSAGGAPLWASNTAQ